VAQCGDEREEPSVDLPIGVDQMGLALTVLEGEPERARVEISEGEEGEGVARPPLQLDR